MENQDKLQNIVAKLTNGLQFGLYEHGSKCYFVDGEHVSYTALWKALRQIHNLHEGHNKNLKQLCPETFMGTFPHKFTKHRKLSDRAMKWLQQVANYVFQAGNKNNMLAQKVSFQLAKG